ncbi:MAG TPA: DUF3179 domain-containing (seleno)protein [Edaphobacter sp.]
MQVQEIQAAKASARKSLGIAVVCALVSALCVAIPMYVIRPFRTQGARELALALEVRHTGPWISGLCAAIALVVLIWSWRKLSRIGPRITMIALCVVAIVGACLTHVNIFEKMFHPYDAPAFGSADDVHVDSDDKVLAVTIAGQARAYPIRTMGYHHIVNDTVGGVPIAVTYCTLCHTGLVWNRMLDGQLLRFRLAGINNGNALMRDEQTSSIWQQSTGEAIFGPLKGRHLDLVHSDELTFALWRKERPQGQVLKPNNQYASEYDPKDWEKHVETTRTVVDTTNSGIGPHQLILGIAVAGKNKAYPIEPILAARLIQDRMAGSSVLVVVGPDKASIRVFEARLDGETTDLTFTKGEGEKVMQDAETGSTWNFQGCAVEGKLVGRCLKEIDSHKDYWFDWMHHHPETAVFRG